MLVAFASDGDLFMFRRLWPVLLLALALSGSAAAQDKLPGLSTLKAGEWNSITPGGDTTCAYGAPYQFFVRPAAQPSSKLMIYLQGGGACWNAQNCSPDYKNILTGRGIFAPEVVTPEEAPAIYNSGILDTSNLENPAADYNTVFLPYCTGDVHTGSASVEWESNGKKYTMHFNGFVNAQAALDWTYANFDKPDTVFVTGSSAGAVGATLLTPYVFRHYPDAQDVHLADGYVGIVPKGWDALKTWNYYGNLPDFLPEFKTVDPADFNILSLYRALSTNFPKAQFSLYTTDLDDTQVLYLFFMGGAKTPKEAGKIFHERMRGLLSDLNTGVSNFHSYIAWGNSHTILLRPEFYQIEVGGVRVRDWVAALLTGQPLKTITCTDCTTPELYQPKAS
jgi:hypothetical protein